MKKLAKHLTFANVVACLALFIALGGASYAAIKLPKNSVGTKQLKNNAITAAKIKDGAVSGSKVAISSLGTVPSAAHAASATSAESAANAQALQGMSPAQIAAAAKVTCPGGMTLVAGTCFEKAARAATEYLKALEICAQAGRLLPTTTELAAFQAATNSSVPEWGGQAYYPGSGTFQAQVLGSGGGSFSIFTPFAYRCSLPASN